MPHRSCQHDVSSNLLSLEGVCLERGTPHLALQLPETRRFAPGADEPDDVCRRCSDNILLVGVGTWNCDRSLNGVANVHGSLQ